VTNFARDAFVLGYAATVGFVAAGIIASFYRYRHHELCIRDSSFDPLFVQDQAEGH
jgi:hypothetical protein